MICRLLWKISEKERGANALHLCHRPQIVSFPLSSDFCIFLGVCISVNLTDVTGSERREGRRRPIGTHPPRVRRRREGAISEGSCIQYSKMQMWIGEYSYKLVISSPIQKSLKMWKWMHSPTLNVAHPFLAHPKNFIFHCRKGNCKMPTLANWEEFSAADLVRLKCRFSSTVVAFLTRNAQTKRLVWW